MCACVCFVCVSAYFFVCARMYIFEFHFYSRYVCHSAPRVYFTLRVFGFKNVAILEGGLKRWHHLGLYLDSGAPTNPAPKQPEAYTKNIDKIVDMETMLKNVGLKEAG